METLPPWSGLEVRQVEQWMLDAFRVKDAILLCSKDFFEALKEKFPEPEPLPAPPKDPPAP